MNNRWWIAGAIVVFACAFVGLCLAFGNPLDRNSEPEGFVSEARLPVLKPVASFSGRDDLWAIECEGGGVIVKGSSREGVCYVPNARLEVIDGVRRIVTTSEAD